MTLPRLKNVGFLLHRRLPRIARSNIYSTSVYRLGMPYRDVLKDTRLGYRRADGRLVIAPVRSYLYAQSFTGSTFQLPNPWNSVYQGTPDYRPKKIIAYGLYLATFYLTRQRLFHPTDESVGFQSLTSVKPGRPTGRFLIPKGLTDYNTLAILFIS